MTHSEPAFTLLGVFLGSMIAVLSVWIDRDN